VSEVVERLSLETDGEYPFHPNWKIYGVSIAAEFCSFYLTALYWGARWGAPEPVMTIDMNGWETYGRETYLLGVEAILHINQPAEMSVRLSSLTLYLQKMVSAVAKLPFS
jgi:hypothetical protein